MCGQFFYLFSVDLCLSLFDLSWIAGCFDQNLKTTQKWHKKQKWKTIEVNIFSKDESCPEIKLGGGHKQTIGQT